MNELIVKAMKLETQEFERFVSVSKILYRDIIIKIGTEEINITGADPEGLMDWLKNLHSFVAYDDKEPIVYKIAKDCNIIIITISKIDDSLMSITLDSVKFDMVESDKNKNHLINIVATYSVVSEFAYNIEEALKYTGIIEDE